MNELLLYMIKHMSFLWDRHGMRICDSLCSSSFGGDAYVTLAEARMYIKVTRDRGQFLLEFKANGLEVPGAWYSVDLMWTLITGGSRSSGVLDSHYVQFLAANFDAIASRFDSDNLKPTLEELSRLQNERSKIL